MVALSPPLRGYAIVLVYLITLTFQETVNIEPHTLEAELIAATSASDECVWIF